MVAVHDLKEFFSEGVQTYSFLSQLFFKELTDDAIEQLASAQYPEASGNESIDQGHRMVRRYLKLKSNDARTQLACEYARIFLNAGMYTETRAVAAPYESIFASEEQLIMQDSRDEVFRWYLQDGFEVDHNLHEPEDHLSFELEYLANMNAKAKELLAQSDWEALQHNITRQHEFIETHLLNWLPDLREVAMQYAQLPFYIGILLITEGFLQMNSEYLEAISQELEKEKNSMCA